VAPTVICIGNEKSLKQSARKVASKREAFFENSEREAFLGEWTHENTPSEIWNFCAERAHVGFGHVVFGMWR
jgi:hypothetical protein